MKLVWTVLIVYGLYIFLLSEFIQGRPQTEPRACQGSVNTRTVGTYTHIILEMQDSGSEGPVSATDTNTYIEPAGTEKFCPTSLPNNVSADLQDRSLCPWYSVLNRNQYRIPKIIKEARCRCNRCVVPARDSLSTFINNCQCEQIFQSMKVLKQVGQCSNGLLVYRCETERIPIGCACAIRRQAVSRS